MLPPLSPCPETLGAAPTSSSLSPLPHCACPVSPPPSPTHSLSHAPVLSSPKTPHPHPHSIYLLYHLLIWVLPCHCKILPPHRLLVLDHHPLPWPLKVHHQLLELLPHPIRDCSPSPVHRSPLFVTREPHISSMGAVHVLELRLDGPGLLQYPNDIGIDSVLQ